MSVGAEEMHRLRLEAQQIENRRQQGLELLREAITVEEQLEVSTLSPPMKRKVRGIISGILEPRGA